MMQPVTQPDLQRFAPHAIGEHTSVLVAGWGALGEAGIAATPLRWCHFLSQIATESGGLRKMREDTRWTGARMKAMWPNRFPLGTADPRIVAARGDAQKLASLAYARINGNEGGGDGWSYRGGGLIQLTGRANYRDCGLAIGVDLEGDPELIEQPEVSLSSAIWFWGLQPNNRFADHNYGRAIGNAINRGNPYSSRDPIGYEHRQQWFNRAWAIWGEGQLPSQDVFWLGAHGRKVIQAQTRLRDLGYPVGAVDGVFGPAMARAVAGFKLDLRRQRPDLGLEPEEGVGVLTYTALETADPAPLSPERTATTERDLAAAGSTEVATGRRAKIAGQAMLYGGIAEGANQLGLLGTLQQAASGVTGLHVTLAPVLGAVQWGLRHALPVALIVAGVWAWIAFRDVILARLAAHQNGSNLGR